MAAADPGRLRAGAGHRPALHPLHLRHHREAQGRGARQRRPRGRAGLDDAQRLRRRPGETIFTASDVGWVVGHSYIVYAPLLAGATTVLYEGKPVGTPDAGQFWRVVAEHGVKSMFTAPTAFRAIKKEDPKGELAGRYDLSGLRYLFLAGERLDPETYRWASDLLGIPVIDHWWQTETGWPIVANPAGIELLPIKPGSPTRPLPGWDVQVLDDAGRQVTAGTDGAIVVKLPMPPGRCRRCGTTTSGSSSSYLSAFDGYYLTGDGGRIDDDGYVFVMGRTDDVINVAGHRLSTGGMEEVLAAHPDVAECAVIGVADAMKGQVPRGFVVLKAGVERDAEQLRAELVAAGPRPGRRGGRRCATWPWSARCPRPAPARSCARRCAGSPTARTSRCPPRSTTPRCSTRCVRCCAGT